MNRAFGNMCYLARKSAGFTQEEAAELLCLSVRTIGCYEQGRVPVDDIVARMVQVYQAPYLGYVYLSQESATGRLLLPKVNVIGVSSGALQLRVGLHRAIAMQDILEEICYDDSITDDELQPLRPCLSAIEELAAACLGMEILGKR